MAVNALLGGGKQNNSHGSSSPLGGIMGGLASHVMGGSHSSSPSNSKPTSSLGKLAGSLAGNILGGNHGSGGGHGKPPSSPLAGGGGGHSNSSHSGGFGSILGGVSSLLGKQSSVCFGSNGL